MEEWLTVVATYTGFAVEFMAIIVIATGSVQAFVSGMRIMLFADSMDDDKRTVWLRFSQALIGGLTFQLAADVIHTAIAPSWDAIGRLAVIAVIRTLLGFFLSRDVAEIRQRIGSKL